MILSQSVSYSAYRLGYYEVAKIHFSLTPPNFLHYFNVKGLLILWGFRNVPNILPSTFLQ